MLQIAHSHVKTQLMGNNVERNVAATTMKFVTSTMGACRLVSYIWGYTQSHHLFVLFLFGVCISDGITFLQKTLNFLLIIIVDKYSSPGILKQVKNISVRHNKSLIHIINFIMCLKIVVVILQIVRLIKQILKFQLCISAEFWVINRFHLL